MVVFEMHWLRVALASGFGGNRGRHAACLQPRHGMAPLEIAPPLAG